MPKCKRATMWIKVCGICNADDAVLAIEAGADAIGVNLVPSSRRSIEPKVALEIARAVGGRARVVAVVADRSVDELAQLRAETGVEWLQLHGKEPSNVVEALLPAVYKAVRIATAADVAETARYPGELLLVDSKIEGVLGGTGRSFDWSLVSELCRARKIVLAGGLTPENVSRAIEAVRPYGVDVASGVDRNGDVRRKDPERVRRFVQAARRAETELR